ncbi:hypothetical protein [Shewanella sp. YLB-07]|uniref:hypothetical protein n=1 Tax=Shewanella sp. YLB-07 TaxID=2601268 RepID=UPI00128CCA88|nr:hypothetical protein [Shewanella sp. YLB-07]MPY24337.1 NYN domain-containing protein [Shewanella sp. YLB-07]
MYKVEGTLEPRDCKRVDIWKLEEKQTDVDAMTEPELEQIVFVTHDTDIAPAMLKIKEYDQSQLINRTRQITIGLVIPLYVARLNQKAYPLRLIAK